MSEEQRSAGGWSTWGEPATSPDQETAPIVPRPDAHMRRVVRLETLTDARDTGDPRSTSVSARHEAVLDDGGRVLLLDDRGWTSSLRGPGADEIDDAWSVTSEDDVAETARMVVGPDEAYGERSAEDMETGHWATLAATLRAHGIAVEAGDLARLPHDVVLSDRLRARLTS